MSDSLLCKKLSKKGFIPEHVAEVGVYSPKTSNIYDYIIQGVKCTLVEPNPKSIKLIKEHFSNYKNITLHEFAVYDYNGKINLVQRNASTFISELNESPAIVNDSYKINDDDKFVVETKRFDEIDDGGIDVLSADVEGSEWYIIKHMISRPGIVSLETHGGVYVNPFIGQINNWMKNNNYEVWYKTKSDTVFVKKGSVKIGFYDKLKLGVMCFYLFMRKLRKKIKRKLFS